MWAGRLESRVKGEIDYNMMGTLSLRWSDRREEQKLEGSFSYKVYAHVPFSRVCC